MEDEAICELCHWKGTAQVGPFSTCPHCGENGSLMLIGVWNRLDVDEHPASTVVEVVAGIDKDLPPNMLGDNDGSGTS
jgi:hypothetical protein